MNTSGSIAHTGASDFANAMTSGGGDGAESFANADGDDLQVGSDLEFGATFAAYEAFLDFDTASVTVEPSAVTLKLTLSGDITDPVSDLVLATYAWGGNPVGTGDWRDPTQLAGLTEAGRVDGATLAGLTTGDVVTITIDPASVVLAGRTQFVLFTQDMVDPIVDPTGLQDIIAFSAQETTPPRLLVDGSDVLDPPPPAPDAVTIKVVTTDGTLVTNLPLARCENITRSKNEPDEAVVVFPKGAYSRDDVHVFADDSGTGDLHEIQIIRNDIVRFWGPAVSAQTDSSTGEVTLNCRGVDWYLWTGRFLDGQRTNELTNPSFEDGDETGWSAVGSLDTHEVTTADAIRGTYSLHLEASTPLGDNYEEQTVSITGTGVGTFVTIVAYFKIETITFHALDRRGLYVEGQVSGIPQTNNYYPIDEATPAGQWIRAKTTIAVPPATTWDLKIRLYAVDSIRWDDCQVVAMQSISTASITGNTYEPVDVSEIVGLLLTHVRSKGTDLNIDLDNPTVGVKQVKHIQWADHISWADQMSEWLDRDDCFDYSIVYTATTRTLTLHVTQQGVDRRDDFTLTYPGNIAHHDFNEDGGGTITEDTQLDQDSGDGPDREEGHYQDASLIGGLILQAVDSAPPKSEPSSLDPLARERVNRARRPSQLLTLTLVNQGADGDPADTVWDELLGLGDAVAFDIADGWATTSGFGRIAQTKEYPSLPKMDITFAKATP